MVKADSALADALNNLFAHFYSDSWQEAAVSAKGEGTLCDGAGGEGYVSKC